MMIINFYYKLVQEDYTHHIHVRCREKRDTERLNQPPFSSLVCMCTIDTPNNFEFVETKRGRDLMNDLAADAAGEPVT